MKSLLKFSLILNCALLTIVAWRAGHDHRVEYPRTVRTTVALREAHSFKRMTHTSPANIAPARPWDTIEARNPAQMIANLRAIGCPEQTIRDIVAFRVCRDYLNRLRAMDTEATRASDYTKNRNWRDWQEQHNRETGLRNAMSSELESLFGQGVEKLRASVLGWPERSGYTDYLALEKRTPLRELTSRFQQLLAEVHPNDPFGPSDPESSARRREIERQKQAALAEILSPQELQEYQMRESRAAAYVRENLPAANSEEEFRKMVKAALDAEMEPPKMDMRRRYGLPGGPDDSEEDRKQAEKKAALDARLKEVLGEQRIAEQQQDEQTRAEQERKRDEERVEQRERARLTAVAEELGVTAEDANRFMDRLKELEPAIQQKLKEMSKTYDGSEEQAKAQKAAIQAEFEKVAVETMGEKGREVMKKMVEGEGVK